MTNLTEKLNNVGEWISKNKKKAVLGIGLVALTATTILKDNVHFVPFGTIEFDSPKKNQYVYGIFQIAKVKGNSEANINSYGLMGGLNIIYNNSSVNNISSYGLIIGSSKVGNLTKINGKIISRGIVSETPTGVMFGTRIEELKNYTHYSKGGKK